MSNEELVLKIQNGDAYLQNELYLNVERLIGQTAYNFYKKHRYLIDNLGSIDYEDVIQLANISFMKSIYKFDISGEFCFTTYLVNVIQLNLHNEFYRNKKISNQYQKDLVSSEIFGDIGFNDKNTENKILLEQLMSVLTEREKEIIKDKYLRGLTKDDMLNKYGISNPMINSIKRTALKKMREEMER